MARDEILDISRGIGILLVIIGHVPFFMVQTNLIYFFHMPFFFYLSGVTRKKQDPLRSLTSGGRLTANYFIYGLLFCALSWLFLEENIKENLQHLFSFKPASIWDISGFGVYWFIVALALLKIVSAAELIYKSWPIGLFLFLIVPFIAKTQEPVSALIIFGPAMLGLFFFQMGRFYTPLMHWIKPRPCNILLSSAIVYFGLATYNVVSFNGEKVKLVNLAHLHVFNPLQVLLLSVSGIILSLAASTVLSSFKPLKHILSFYGRYSFILFVTHLFFIQVFYVALPQDWWEHHLIFNRVVVLTVVLVACTILAQLVHRMPGKRTTIKKLLLMQ